MQAFASKSGKQIRAGVVIAAVQPAKRWDDAEPLQHRERAWSSRASACRCRSAGPAECRPARSIRLQSRRIGRRVLRPAPPIHRGPFLPPLDGPARDPRHRAAACGLAPVARASSTAARIRSRCPCLDRRLRGPTLLVQREPPLLPLGEQQALPIEECGVLAKRAEVSPFRARRRRGGESHLRGRGLRGAPLRGRPRWRR